MRAGGGDRVCRRAATPRLARGGWRKDEVGSFLAVRPHLAADKKTAHAPYRPPGPTATGAPRLGRHLPLHRRRAPHGLPRLPSPRPTTRARATSRTWMPTARRCPPACPRRRARPLAQLLGASLPLYPLSSNLLGPARWRPRPLRLLSRCHPRRMGRRYRAPHRTGRRRHRQLQATRHRYPHTGPIPTRRHPMAPARAMGATHPKVVAPPTPPRRHLAPDRAGPAHPAHHRGPHHRPDRPPRPRTRRPRRLRCGHVTDPAQQRPPSRFPGLGALAGPYSRGTPHPGNPRDSPSALPTGGHRPLPPRRHRRSPLPRTRARRAPARAPATRPQALPPPGRDRLAHLPLEDAPALAPRRTTRPGRADPRLPRPWIRPRWMRRSERPSSTSAGSTPPPPPR